MDEKDLNCIKESLHDCHDRKEVCPVESDDFLTLSKQEAEIAKILVDEEKNKMDHEIELEKIKLERAKIENENKWWHPKFWVGPVLGFVGVVASGFMYRRTLREHRRETMEFENDGHMFTSMAGRSNSSGFKFPGGKGLM